MGSLFEVWLCGEDPEHLAAVGEAVLDDCERVELLLSRFDPAAELARVNRQAGTAPVLVSYELFDILQDCARYWALTDGFFDITVGGIAHETARRSGQNLVGTADGHTGGAAFRPAHGPAGFADVVRLDPQRRTVSFLTADVALDLGGFGKGYALDSAFGRLAEFGVESAFAHGGTSSAVARGSRGEERWQVGIRNPFHPDAEDDLAQIELCDAALSSSAALSSDVPASDGSTSDAPSTDVPASDVINPATGQLLIQQTGCSVVAPTASLAEVLSTAVLAMGKQRAVAYLGREEPWLQLCRVAWIEQAGDAVSLEWLTGVPR